MEQYRTPIALDQVRITDELYGPTLRLVAERVAAAVPGVAHSGGRGPSSGDVLQHLLVCQYAAGTAYFQTL